MIIWYTNFGVGTKLGAWLSMLIHRLESSSAKKSLENPLESLEDTQIAWKTDEDNKVGSLDGYLVIEINNYSEDLWDKKFW